MQHLSYTAIGIDPMTVALSIISMTGFIRWCSPALGSSASQEFPASLADVLYLQRIYTYCMVRSLVGGRRPVHYGSQNFNMLYQGTTGEGKAATPFGDRWSGCRRAYDEKPPLYS